MDQQRQQMKKQLQEMREQPQQMKEQRTRTLFTRTLFLVREAVRRAIPDGKRRFLYIRRRNGAEKAAKT